jgi:hypothetical protein
MSSGRDVGLKRPNLRPKPVNVQCRWYYCEVQRHKAGRKARIGGLAEVIAGPLRCPDAT